MARSILISAGEASGDLYAAELARRLAGNTNLFGCTGPRMRAAGVETVVDAASLAVVGLVEVTRHIPSIYKQYRKLVTEARRRRPDVAILTDSPDFHLRVASNLHRDGIPVVYLVAPQVWAWRPGRIKMMRRVIHRLLCIFPFEEAYFRDRGLNATYIGHPLATLIRPQFTREEFFRKHRLAQGRPVVTVLPGSRRGEAARHLAGLLDAVDRLNRDQAANFLLPASATAGAAFFQERIGGAPVKVIEGETWDAIAHADVALAASGTVTIEAALLGTPMVTFYKVTSLSWLMGKALVRVPYYCMVNLVAERKVVPELMQSEMTGARLAEEARRLLSDSGERARMKAGLAEVAARLTTGGDALDRAAAVVASMRQ
ncbi:MAG: lipid-A-disaccharide synthase [Bryobacteraceae bacterium]